MKILIAVPTFENIYPDTFKAIYDADAAGHELSFEYVRGYDCATARNRIAQAAIDQGADHVLMVDNDVVIPRDIIQIMTEDPRDVILGYYAHRDNDNIYRGRTCICRREMPDGKLYFNYPLESEYTAEELQRERESGIKKIHIHGGGMDLVFPHHECEIAQATASQGHPMVKYWMHNNMLTINGQKMGKSYNNFITLEQFFTGNHPLLEKAYSPMTIRFFVLSAHYRGTVDFSNEALVAAERGYEKLMNAISDLARIQVSPQCDPETEKVVKTLRQRCYDAMNDDFATPQVISLLFEACTVVNKLVDHKATICADCLKELSETMHLFAFDILGLQTSNLTSQTSKDREEAFGRVVDMVLELRAKAKADKDWATSDRIRDELAAAGFEVKDTKDGVTWKLNK